MPESLAAHEEDFLIPAELTQLDFEGEVAIVIGKRGRRIAREKAHEYVAGYACYNDGSVRDWQAMTTQWTAGKNFPRTGAFFGPWMVTSDEIPFGTELELITRVNGKEMQRASTKQLIHGLADLVSHVSTFATLDPGDVIVTGTHPIFAAIQSATCSDRAGLEVGTPHVLHNRFFVTLGEVILPLKNVLHRSRRNEF